MDKGRFVIVTPEELEAIEPGRSRTIDIEDFVELDAIDPIVWNDTYYLAPDGEAAAKPHALLREAMLRTGRVAIGRFVMRTKQYLATIRPLGDAADTSEDKDGMGGLLAFETMYFADEVRGADDIEDPPAQVELSGRELATAEQLIDALTADWDHAAYRDTYRDRVAELIKKKGAGEQIVIEAEEPAAEVTDLMEALRASVEASKQRRRGGEDAPKPDAGHGTGAAADDATALTELTKEQLYDRATRAGVSGRSKMSKEELVEALQGRRAS